MEPGGVRGQTLPRAPVFCRAELDLYRVLVEAMCLGGYELVTEEKRWKQVARTLGKDLTTQTSASFALRNYYQRYLLEFEMWLWDNADTLGPRPEEFNPQTKQRTRSSSPSPSPRACKGDGRRWTRRAGGEKPPPASAEEEEEEEDDDDDGPRTKRCKEGEEDFDPDAESDEGEEDDESDEDFAVGPTSAGKRKRDDDDESD